ncbi:phosphatase PAP2 family protein [Aeromonas sp. MdU4]|uniref:phosphatase PAP2 family protein n=1 Tax=Aeromonas sp. MdU4 TaxID=3342819 RepID=UPI0035BB1F5C
MYHASETSFPSDHATLFFSAGLSLFAVEARISGALILFLSIFVVWSRVFLGLHFPLDIAGAAVMALLAYLLVKLFFFRIEYKFMAFCESISSRLFHWLTTIFTP